MTDTVALALIAAVPGVIASILGYMTKKRADTIIVKAGEIHALTNSNLTAVKAALEEANARIEALQSNTPEGRSGSQP